MEKVYFILKFLWVAVYTFIVLPPKIWFAYWKVSHNTFLVFDAFISAPHILIPGFIMLVVGHWAIAIVYCLAIFIFACVYRMFIIYYSHLIIKPDNLYKVQEFMSEFLLLELEKRSKFLNTIF